MLIPLRVFTKIKNDFSQTIKDTYSMTDNNFSMRNTNTKAVFPFVFVSMLASSPIAKDLQVNSINAGRFGFQIEVYDNQTQTRARKVMTEIQRIMVEEMGFEPTSIPNFQETNDNTVRMISRFTREIGAGDKLNF
jgi:hypothetical protein